MKAQYYVLTIEGGIEPTLSEGFDTEEERDEEARQLAHQQDTGCDSCFRIDVDEAGQPHVDAYAAGEFDEDPNTEDEDSEPRRR
jgi:hypothetical protein